MKRVNNTDKTVFNKTIVRNVDSSPSQFVFSVFTISTTFFFYSVNISLSLNLQMII